MWRVISSASCKALWQVFTDKCKKAIFIIRHIYSEFSHYYMTCQFIALAHYPLCLHHHWLPIILPWWHRFVGMGRMSFSQPFKIFLLSLPFNSLNSMVDLLSQSGSITSFSLPRVSIPAVEALWTCGETLSFETPVMILIPFLLTPTFILLECHSMIKHYLCIASIRKCPQTKLKSKILAYSDFALASCA